MQIVSQDWKNNQAQHLVEESFVNIAVGLSDPIASADASAITPDAIWFANTKQITDGTRKDEIPFATLEHNIWPLNGTMSIISHVTDKDTGFVSSMLCDENCVFNPSPIISIMFTKTHMRLVSGVTIKWAPAYNEFATDFTITVYNGTTVIGQKHITDNDTVDTVVDLDLINYNRITIEINKWCMPYMRARLLNIMLGKIAPYLKSDIISFNQESHISPISSATPKLSLTYVIDNTESEHDFDNPSGLNNYLIERQSVTIQYGYKFGNEIEWIDGGKYYLSEWNLPQDGISATFKARDILEFMSETYNKGRYVPTGVSLYVLASEVLEDADLPLHTDGNVPWHIDDLLKSITTIAPLPRSSHAECLQLIANAACCVLRYDRTGRLHIEPLLTKQTDYKINRFNSFSNAVVELSKPLHRVDVQAYKYIVEADTIQLFYGTISVSEMQSFWIVYTQSASSVSATINGGTLQNAIYYAHACKLTIAVTPSSAFTSLYAPPSSSYAGKGAAFSPDGRLCVVVHDIPQDMFIYRVVGETFTKLGNPSAFPSGSLRSVAFSPNGNLCVVAHTGTPFISIYRVTGETFTKLSNPSDLPPNYVNCVAFSPDGNLCIAGHPGTPFMSIYRVAGEAFTKLENPSALPAGTVYGVAFSPNGNLCAVAHTGTPFISIYRVTGETFTKLPNPASLPAGGGRGIAFSPDGSLCVIVHSGTPFISIYRVTGETFTKLPNPAIPPSGIANGVAFSPNGNFCVVAHDTYPYMSIYWVTGETFTKISTKSTVTAANTNAVAFSPDSKLCVVPHEYAGLGTPAMSLYLTDISPVTVTATVTGRALQYSQTTISSSFNETGDIQSVQNILITDYARAGIVGKWVGEYINNRTMLSYDWRADPRLDALDIISSLNKYREQSAIMTDVTLNYNGGFRGTGKGRVLSD